MPKKIDETGNSYGELTVIRFSHSSNHKQNMWLCLCKCGREAVVKGAHLRQGDTKSCGKCNRLGPKNPKFVDRTGLVYGRLRVDAQGPTKTKPRRRVMWWCVCDPELGGCGKRVLVDSSSLGGGNTRSCGCLKRDTRKLRVRGKAANWKGGRKKDRKGYICVKDPEHPNAQKCGYVRENIKVMSDHLGRPIDTKNGEQVHHKNNFKDDNRIENLELWTTSHPSGSRVSDKIAWAKEFLEQYGYECNPRA